MNGVTTPNALNLVFLFYSGLCFMTVSLTNYSATETTKKYLISSRLLQNGEENISNKEEISI